MEQLSDRKTIWYEIEVLRMGVWGLPMNNRRYKTYDDARKVVNDSNIMRVISVTQIREVADRWLLKDWMVMRCKKCGVSNYGRNHQFECWKHGMCGRCYHGKGIKPRKENRAYSEYTTLGKGR